jgi:Zn-dependent protease with chaperone function
MSGIQKKDIVKQFIRIISYALKHRNDYYTNKAIEFLRRMNIYYGFIIVCNYNKKDFPQFGIAASIGLSGLGIIFIEKSFFEDREIPEELKEFIIAHEVAHIVRSHAILSLLTRKLFEISTEAIGESIEKAETIAETIVIFLLGLFLLFSLTMVDINVVKSQELEADNLAIQLAGYEGALHFAKMLEVFKKQGIDVSHEAILGVPALTIEERINNLRQHYGFFFIV